MREREREECDEIEWLWKRNIHCHTIIIKFYVFLSRRNCSMVLTIQQTGQQFNNNSAEFEQLYMYYVLLIFTAV